MLRQEAHNNKSPPVNIKTDTDYLYPQIVRQSEDLWNQLKGSGGSCNDLSSRIEIYSKDM